MTSYAQKLQDKQITAVVFDFPGGGYNIKSSGKIEDMSLLTEINDLNQVIDYIKTFNFIDPNQIYLAGHSQGGFISSLIAVERSDINALFLFAPAYVIVDDVCEVKMRKKNVLTLMDELGSKYINDAKKVNFPLDIKEYDKPVIIFQGKKDTRVPEEYAYKASEAYGDNCELIIFDEEEHRFTDKTKNIIVTIIKDTINTINEKRK